MSDHVSSVEVPFMETDMLKIRYPSNPELRINYGCIIYRLRSAKFAFGEFDVMVCDTISKDAQNELICKLAGEMGRLLIDSVVEILEAKRQGVES